MKSLKFSENTLLGYHTYAIALKLTKENHSNFITKKSDKLSNLPTNQHYDEKTEKRLFMLNYNPLTLKDCKIVEMSKKISNFKIVCQEKMTCQFSKIPSKCVKFSSYLKFSPIPYMSD